MGPGALIACVVGLAGVIVAGACIACLVRYLRYIRRARAWHLEHPRARR